MGCDYDCWGCRWCQPKPRYTPPAPTVRYFVEAGTRLLYKGTNKDEALACYYAAKVKGSNNLTMTSGTPTRP